MGLAKLRWLQLASNDCRCCDLSGCLGQFQSIFVSCNCFYKCITCLTYYFRSVVDMFKCFYCFWFLFHSENQCVIHLACFWIDFDLVQFVWVCLGLSRSVLVCIGLYRFVSRSVSVCLWLEVDLESSKCHQNIVSIAFLATLICPRWLILFVVATMLTVLWGVSTWRVNRRWIVEVKIVTAVMVLLEGGAWRVILSCLVGLTDVAMVVVLGGWILARQRLMTVSEYYWSSV